MTGIEIKVPNTSCTTKDNSPEHVESSNALNTTHDISNDNQKSHENLNFKLNPMNIESSERKIEADEDVVVVQ